MNTPVLVMTAIAIGLASGCSSGVPEPTTPEPPLPPPGPGAETVFATSFEADADTAGWRAEAEFVIVSDTPPGGGGRAVLVSAGCLHPHSAKVLPPAPRAGRLSLRVWGKNLSNGGSAVLENMVTGEAISANVLAKEWTGYQSESGLAVRKGERARITLNAGGFLASGALFDLIEVVRVD